MLRRINGKTLVNVDAVGRPLLPVPLGSSDNRIVAPSADYTVIDSCGGHLSIDFRHVPLDLGSLDLDAARSEMPHRERRLSQFNRDLTLPLM